MTSVDIPISPNKRDSQKPAFLQNKEEEILKASAKEVSATDEGDEDFDNNFDLQNMHDIFRINNNNNNNSNNNSGNKFDEYSEIPCYKCEEKGENVINCSDCKGRGFLIYNDKLRKIEKLIDEKLKSLEAEFCRGVFSSLQRKKVSKGYFDDENKKKKFVEGFQNERQETNYRCNKCESRINGIRYHCSICDDFDWCEDCETSNNHEHPLWKIRPKKNLNNSQTNPRGAPLRSSTNILQSMPISRAEAFTSKFWRK